MLERKLGIKHSSVYKFGWMGTNEGVFPYLQAVAKLTKFLESCGHLQAQIILAKSYSLQAQQSLELSMHQGIFTKSQSVLDSSTCYSMLPYCSRLLQASLGHARTCWTLLERLGMLRSFVEPPKNAHYHRENYWGSNRTFHPPPPNPATSPSRFWP